MVGIGRESAYPPARSVMMLQSIIGYPFPVPMAVKRLFPAYPSRGIESCAFARSEQSVFWTALGQTGGRVSQCTAGQVPNC